MLPTPRRDAPSAPTAGRSRDARVRAGMMVLAPASAKAAVAVSGSAKPPKNTTVDQRRRSAGAGSQRGVAVNSATSGASKTKRVEDDFDEEDDEKAFLDMRRQAKQASHASQKIVPTPPLAIPLLRSSEELRQVVVDPSYFDYGASYRALQAKREATQETGQQSGAACSREDSSVAELMEFLGAQGLTGPLRTYARSLALQGIRDSTSLVQIDDAQLENVIERAELESTDELFLREALQMFR